MTSDAWLTMYAAVDTVMEQIDFQTAYVRDLMALTDYQTFDLELVRRHFVTWEHDKDESHHRLPRQIVRLAVHRHGRADSRFHLVGGTR